MKEEDWRDAYSLGFFDPPASAVNKRYKLSEILEVTDLYRASPGGDLGVGQMLFAMPNAQTQCLGPSCSVCVGMCVPGCNLIPVGIRCCFCCGGSMFPCQCENCVACGFSIGGLNTSYVALGSINGCGATLWRRIS